MKEVIVLLFIYSLAFLSAVDGQCSVKTATQKFRSAIFDFSADIVKHIAEQEDYHFIVSPMSLWTLLSTTAEGAKGTTYEELRRVLHLNKHTCFRNRYYSLVKSLSEVNGDVTFLRNGVIIIDNACHLKQDFISRVNRINIADVENIDFSNSYNASRHINDYVKTKTHEIINEVIHPDAIENAVMILVDTVYFNGPWNASFDPASTVPSVFYDDYQSEIGQVNQMYSCGWFNVAELSNIHARVLELPYGSEDRFAMLIFLPNDGFKLESVIEYFDMTSIAAVYHELVKRGPEFYDVYLPRFKIESSLDLVKEVLIDLGVKKVFQKEADLSGMLESPAFIGKITQKAFIEVSEKGTVASAASTGVFQPRTVPELFQVNKPFFYLIVEKVTHTVMFAGAYSKPSLE